MSLSCVIPTHGRPDRLRAALQAVALQTLPPSEVVVVDDLADTRTEDVVRRAGEAAAYPIRYLAHPEGSGASSSRNLGAAHAAGDLLAFLDDDDRWAPSYLETAVATLVRERCDAVFTWIQVYLDSVRGPRFQVPPGLAAADVLARNPGVTGSNIVVRACVLAEIGGFDERLSVSEDKDVLVRLLDLPVRYAVVEEFLVEKHEHAGPRLSISGGRRLASLRAYHDKHRARLTPRDRRVLQFEIHRLARKIGPTGLERLRAGWRLVALMRGSEIVQLVDALRIRGARFPLLGTRARTALLPSGTGPFR